MSHVPQIQSIGCKLAFGIVLKSPVCSEMRPSFMENPDFSFLCLHICHFVKDILLFFGRT